MTIMKRSEPTKVTVTVAMSIRLGNLKLLRLGGLPYLCYATHRKRPPLGYTRPSLKVTFFAQTPTPTLTLTQVLQVLCPNSNPNPHLGSTGLSAGIQLHVMSNGPPRELG